MQSSSFITVRDRGVLNLPADIRRRHGLDKPGTQLQVIERDDGVIELRPYVAIPADQAWFWSKRWQEMEKEVDKHVEEGAVKTHEDADAFKSHLESL